MGKEEKPRKDLSHQKSHFNPLSLGVLARDRHGHHRAVLSWGQGGWSFAPFIHRSLLQFPPEGRHNPPSISLHRRVQL